MILLGEPIKKAMIAVGFAPSTASDHPESLTQNPVFQNAKEELKNSIWKAGVNFDILARKVKEGLDASRKMRVYETGETEEVPDHDAQIKWWDRGARGLGAADDDKGPGNTTVNILMLIKQARSERGLEE